jgi:hypothetical protein
MINIPKIILFGVLSSWLVSACIPIPRTPYDEKIENQSNNTELCGTFPMLVNAKTFNEVQVWYEMCCLAMKDHCTPRKF